jgi:hypothetical protein
MRPALIAALVLGLAAPAGARAGTPIALAERQIVSLEFARPVARLAVTDPDVIALGADGTRVRLTGLRGGRASLEVVFDDGAVAAFDVIVDASRPGATAAAHELRLAIGEERRVDAPGVARVLLEENGVARVRLDGGAVHVLGVSPGAASLVLVDGAGGRTSWSVRVR